MLTSAEIRQTFLDFFKSKEHLVVPSAPIVVKNDPTLLFTNAGMNQFKDYFLGNKKAPNTRIADTQKCLRVSGKHNDLEEVGVDTYHHTMFEMLGNWSFGDYFKAEAIAWSWELLTEVYKLDRDRLYVTIFEGDAKEQLPKDEEAYNEWKKVIAEDRILPGNKKDNFWEMGDTGPCGPCTEIHFDCRPDEERKNVDGKTLVNNDHPQVIEIWNNVFIQFNRLKDGSLEPLPAKHVDTGMGYERLVRVLQQKTSNYDTDVFAGTIAATENITGKKYDYSDSKEAISFRVIADHIRAIGFTIADGQLPSNTGAGYVIRRILRRAVRYYYSYLDYKQPLLFQLMPVIGKQFENVFPELEKQIDFVSKVIKEEEEAFLRTLDKGLKRIDDIIEAATASKVINGKAAFELFDTYGFPIDLTRLIAGEQNLSVDEAGFTAEMNEQKNRSRAATAIDAEDWVVLDEKPVKFVGYEDINVTTKVLKYRSIRAKGKEQYQLVLETTPFYAESGGQVGDTGKLFFGEEVIDVTDTKKENELIIHFTNKLPAEINIPVKAVIDTAKRIDIAGNHTATHLMHAALRKVLGKHVQQKGSLVNAEHLRFDFSHFAKMSDDELRQVELIVNDKIRENIKVEVRYLPKEEAMANGAMALFGEKYGDTVRVVTVDPNFSVELCGGTHVFYTGAIGNFKILSEAATAAGVRRIEAITGVAAQNYFYEQLRSIKEIAAVLKTSDPVKALKQIVDDKNALEKKVERLENRLLNETKKELLQQVVEINGFNFIGAVLEATSAEALKKLCFDFKSALTNYVVVLAANIDGKANVAVLIDENIVNSKGLEAPKIIKEHIAPLIKGGGGGQKTLATAGGQDASNLNLVVEKVKALLQ
ncbi:MAG TPA: alanine--tRNA ligase [Panacibacter sp.]|nr:alanine--tRNA ligase [Panacibacter sp.]HNP44279.1 alanine--tRNA ligase [Panacibacter sp.]